MKKQSIINCFLSSGLLLCSHIIFANEPNVQKQIDDKTVAVKALIDMSSYLRSLDQFSVVAQLNTDKVLDNGQKIQLSKTAVIKADPPSKLWAKVSSNYNIREFFFDGNIFTLSTPQIGFYASFKTPKTIAKTLDKAKEIYGVELPLNDLFSWGADNNGTANIDNAIIVGINKVNGISCNQFAFREKNIDWQICIQRGKSPLPLKLIITSKLEKSHPQYSAVLKWDTAPVLNKKLFVFEPRISDIKINFTKLKANL